MRWNPEFVVDSFDPLPFLFFVGMMWCGWKAFVAFPDMFQTSDLELQGSSMVTVAWGSIGCLLLMSFLVAW